MTAGTPATARKPTYSRSRCPARAPPSTPPGRGRGTAPAGRSRRPAPPRGDGAAAASRCGTSAAQAARWWPAALVVAAVMAARGLGHRDQRGAPRPGPCTVAGLIGDADVRAGRRRDARSPTSAATRGLPDRASSSRWPPPSRSRALRNLDYGDRDSLGLFQQRPSQGWGTEAQVQDPVYAAGIFYDRLVAGARLGHRPADRRRPDRAAQRTSRRPTSSGGRWRSS